MTPSVTPIHPAMEMRISNKNKESKIIGTLLNPPINDKVEPLVNEIVQKADAQTPVVKKPEPMYAS